MWRGRKAEVTCVARSHSGRLIAVGYADGSIILWSTADGAEGTAFQGHKGSVTALAFDADDVRLASGARDTTVIVWDVVGERGLYRYAHLESGPFPLPSIGAYLSRCCWWCVVSVAGCTGTRTW